MSDVVSVLWMALDLSERGVMATLRLSGGRLRSVYSASNEPLIKGENGGFPIFPQI
jgi:hypothetical protein